MAHLIDQSTGKAAAFFAGEPAWHKLGTVVKEAQTSDEAIRLAGLDWRVEKRDIAAAVPGGGWAPIANRWATVRTDTNAALGVVGTDYRPFQNRDAFDFMDAIVADKLAMFETAGALKGGRTVWMLARLPVEVRAAADDVVHPYVLLTNGHDGYSALRILPTSVRVVCWNTLNLALGKAGVSGLTINHTESLEGRVKEAREKLGVIAKRVDRFSEEVKVLAKRSLSSTELATYFAGLVEARAEKSQKKLLESFLVNFENERNNLPGIKGSAWAAYNAVSEWADHEMTVRGKGDEALENRVSSIWFGASSTFKANAWANAVALAV